ncbi:MAG: RNA 2',3'-cyclic phosphodiesterase [Halobacteriovorax sp.]|nr:RNA 2',3'-cyclic phosphodiesterase [Halobacteriovorax sp.]
MIKIGRGLNRCPECQVPKELCYCARVETSQNKIPVTIIMHRRERFLTSNTAVVAARALSNCNIVLRGMKDQSASAEIEIDPNHVPLVLFPSEDALEIGSDKLKQYLGGRTPHLIVPDGSWGQAKRVARREPVLADVQAVKLSNTGPSLYRLRRQVMEGRLCTYEAIARALGDLESLELEQRLMKVMATMDHAHSMARGVDKYDDGSPDPLTQRLFVGIRVGTPPQLINDIRQARPDFDWVDPLNYHLTMAFIGRLRRSQKEKLISRLEKIDFNSFALSFHTLNAFDSKDNPSVLWLEPEKSQALLDLTEKVRQVILDEGIPLEFKVFTPHWTIARTRGFELKEGELSPFFDQHFDSKTHVDKLVLFEGHGGRSVYAEALTILAKDHK